jgi:hypothetical protein
MLAESRAELAIIGSATWWPAAVASSAAERLWRFGSAQVRPRAHIGNEAEEEPVSPHDGAIAEALGEEAVVAFDRIELGMASANRLEVGE